MCTTSQAAYDLAKKLIDEHQRRVAKDLQKKSNLPRQPPEVKKKKRRDDVPEEGPSRTVTQIDYEKHQRTVEELDLQEKEEKLAQKRLQEQNRPPPGSCSHDHQKEWAIYEKSTEDKIRAADRFRQEGNEAYRKQNYGLAAVHYRKALLQFDYTFAETPEEETSLESVKLPCLLNLAACKFQQEEWDDVLTQCRLALEINPRSVKAFYRTGLAHLARDHFDLAKESLLSAYEIEPANPEVLAALRQLKQKMATYKNKTKFVFSSMVSGTEEAESADASGTPSSDAQQAAIAPQDSQPSTEGEAPPVKEPAESGAAAPGGSHQSEAADKEDTSQDTKGADGGTLRRRNVADKKDDAPAADEDDEDNEDAALVDPKYLRIIFVAAACMGVVALLSVAALVFYGSDR